QPVIWAEGDVAGVPVTLEKAEDSGWKFWFQENHKSSRTLLSHGHIDDDLGHGILHEIESHPGADETDTQYLGMLKSQYPAKMSRGTPIRLSRDVADMHAAVAADP